jgi:SAM-dependent methyltransferase
MRREILLAVVFVVQVVAAAGAQTAPAAGQKPFEPTVGQSGKDVVWVPTPAAVVEKMLDMAKVTPQDFVMDLGSGDGRNIIAAAKRGANGLGVEFNPEMVELSRRSAAAAGVADRAKFVEGDMYAADISKATVLALFLLPHNLNKLTPKFLDLPPGTRIVGNTFAPEGLGGRRNRDGGRRLFQLVHVAPLDRSRKGRGHLEDRRRSARAETGIPDGVGDADGRRQDDLSSAAGCAETC